MKQNPSIRIYRSYRSRRDSRTLSSDFDKFLRSRITSRHLKVPRGDVISGNKTWPFTDRRGYRSLKSGFLLESPSTYRRPSPSARPAERLETRAALWSIFIQWNAQYGPRLSVPQLLDLKWKTRDRREVFLQLRVLIAFKMSPIVSAECKRVSQASK